MMSDPRERTSPMPPSQSSATTKQKHDVNMSSKRTDSVASDAIVLIPQPSDDSRDPLNWPFKKKLTIGLTLWFALFMSYSAPFNGQIQIAQQAALYHKTVVEITYFVSH